jgi:hypothetical protein
MKRGFSLWDLLAFEGDAGGAAGAGAGAPAAGGLAAAAAAAAAAAGGGTPGAGDGGAGGPPAAQNNGSLYFPDGMPDTYRGTTVNETIDKLWGDINGRPKPPAKPEEYKLELSPELQKKFGDLTDDKVLPIWRETAHELGLNDAQFQGAFVKLYDKMEKAGLIEQAPDYAAEFEKLQPKTGDTRTRAVAAMNRVNDATAFVKGLETRAGFGKQHLAMLASLVETAAGVETIEGIMKLTSSPGIVGGGTAGDGGVYGWDAATKDMADERYSTSSPKHDPAFRKSVDEKMAKLPRKQIQPNKRVG